MPITRDTLLQWIADMMAGALDGKTGFESPMSAAEQVVPDRQWQLIAAILAKEFADDLLEAYRTNGNGNQSAASPVVHC